MNDAERERCHAAWRQAWNDAMAQHREWRERRAAIERDNFVDELEWERALARWNRKHR